MSVDKMTYISLIAHQRKSLGAEPKECIIGHRVRQRVPKRRSGWTAIDLPVGKLALHMVIISRDISSFRSFYQLTAPIHVTCGRKYG